MATPNATRAPVAWPGALIELRRWRPGIPLLLLILGAVVALTVGYLIQPLTTIDVGARFDYPYLDGVNAREFSPGGSGQRFAWPANSAELAIPGPLRSNERMLTLTLDDWRPDERYSRRLIAVYVGNRRVDTLSDRGGDRRFGVLLPEDLDFTNGFLVRIEPLADRTLDIPPVNVVEAEVSSARTYRWTRDRAMVAFPALGRGDWRIDLTALVAHPDNGPVDARVYANGTLIANLPESGAIRHFQILAPASAVGNGDLTVEITATPYYDPRPLGILLERVAVAPLNGGGPGAALPPWSALFAALTIVLCMYGALRVIDISGWVACGAAGLVALIGAGALAIYRYPTGLFIEPLAWFMLFTLALTPLLDRALEWSFRQLDIPLVPWLRHALLLVFLGGLWLKGGGLLFPYMRAIDVGWHMDRVRWILDGHWAEMYLPGAFSESVMPIDEWGPNRPVIPYSPFFHLFATLFAVFPWSLETSTNLFSALLDNSRVFVIAILARKAGLANRTTLFAALIYAVTPVTFLLHSWGNVPTTSGMWWTLLTSTAMVALYPRLGRRGPFILLTVLTLITLLFYTVMAVFHVAFVMLFVLLALIVPSGLDRRPLRPVVLSLLLAIAASLLIYYGQYIPPILERTVPYVMSLATRGPESVGVERAPFGEYMLAFWPHLRYDMRPDGFLYYGLLIPLIFVLPGFWSLRRHALIWIMLAAWFSVGVLFMLVGYRVSMVDKQLFYIVPAISLCFGVYAERFWRRGWWGKVMIVTIYAFTLATALDLWIIRIIRSPVA